MNKTIAFEQVIERGCGIDVHKKVLVATIRGSDLKEQTKSFDCPRWRSSMTGAPVTARLYRVCLRLIVW